jgi:hypothetical protein
MLQVSLSPSPSIRATNDIPAPSDANKKKISNGDQLILVRNSGYLQIDTNEPSTFSCINEGLNLFCIYF